MSGIVTITLNPAIDKSTSIESLAPEKKLKCAPPVFEPGGGGVNVARALKKLGGNATALYFAGGYTGTFFTQLLDKEGIQSSVIPIGKHTRENLIVFDRSSALQYRFGMPGPQIEEKEWKELLAAVEQINDADFIIASGSIPLGVPADIFARIGEITKRKNIKYIVDTSGEALKGALETDVILLKPNLGELSALSGKNEFTSHDQIFKAASYILSKGHCQGLIISMGASGAFFISAEHRLQIIPPAVKRKSTVGAGDSMVAGIVLALSKGYSLPDAARYGVACGTAATINPGTALCDKEDADIIMQQLTCTNL